MTAAELLKHKRVHLAGPYDEQTRWDRWFRPLDIDTRQMRPGIAVNSRTNLVEAALDGRGFALIGPPLIERFLRGRALIRPVKAPPVVRHALHLLMPRGGSPSVSSRQFSDGVRLTHERKAAA